MRCRRSARFTAVAATSSTTSPGPGDGVGDLAPARAPRARRAPSTTIALTPGSLAQRHGPARRGASQNSMWPASIGSLAQARRRGPRAAARAGRRSHDSRRGAPGPAAPARGSAASDGAGPAISLHAVTAAGREKRKRTRPSAPSLEEGREVLLDACRGRGRGAWRGGPRAPRRRLAQPSSRRTASASSPARPGASATAGSTRASAADAVRAGGGQGHADQPAERVPDHRGPADARGVERLRRGPRRAASTDHGGSQVERPWPRRSGASDPGPGQLLLGQAAVARARVRDAVDDEHRPPVGRAPRRAGAGGSSAADALTPAADGPPAIQTSAAPRASGRRSSRRSAAG